MTRKKWNRLRRQRPDLFCDIDFQSWETMSREDEERVRKLPKRRCLEVITNYLVTLKLNDQHPTPFRRRLIGLANGSADDYYWVVHKRKLEQ